ncbi:MAG TPA: VWA domain-containing protein, partial [Nannocystis exedens]|nr:VWA domain-containing protein [Nannocystis exedens]
MRLRHPTTHLLRALSCAFVLGIACNSDDTAQETQGSCAIGSIGCACTDGGGCDSGLVCQEGICQGEATGTGSETGTSSSSSSTGGATMGGTTGTSTSMGASSDPSTGSSTASFKLDIGVETTTDDPPPEIGCTKIDLLFVLDGSGSMAEERSSLAGIGAFTSIINTLSDLGEGNIDYRVALTTDNDNGYIAPPGCWDGGEPWVASEGKDPAEVAAAFNCAVATFGTNKYEASVGCEHVLTSAVDLLDGDASGFVREDALL